MSRPTAKIALFAGEPFEAGKILTLAEDAANHLRVVRAALGDSVDLRDGRGGVGSGTIARMARGSVTVDVTDAEHVEPLPAIHLMAPIGDRDRMLWLGEKATEIGVTSWRPVLWKRSKSVSPRGEGTMFMAKLRARMISALLQSRGAWLPEIHPDAPPERAIAAAPAGARFLLHLDGAPMLAAELAAPVTIAVGPEGGIEEQERAAFVESGFSPVTLGATTLRFETAGVAAAAIARAATSLSTQDHV
ncbi:MAG TPA: RsmE family RNA methyltransferase [Gemmatimonadaceae bacterium]|nr:RsmE family RNA methyltransferase [Gemmatimonadaceae bacterium]